MYSFPLSNGQENTIQTWLSKKDKPLFITGHPGCGKSTLANQLVSDYHIVHINSDHLKYSGNLIEYIENTLFKKDILMMCSKNHYKALCIDDVQLFIKYDKSTIINLIQFIKTIHTHYPVIIVSDNIEHKYINQIYTISYNISLRFPISYYTSILKEGITKPINNSHLTSYIHKSSKNLHSLKLNVTGLYTNSTDNNYTITDIIKLLHTQNISCSDIFRLCTSEYITLSLNILENAPHIIRTNLIDTLYQIYNSICIGDSIEVKYIDKSIDNDILILFCCYVPYKYMTSNPVSITNYTFKYNSYISKSLIQIHNQTLLSVSSVDYIKLVDLFYQYNLKDTSKEIQEMISFVEFNTKTLEKQMKVYNYYYNKQLTKKYINKILKTII
jgi:ABC-type oligopeptide transport system ATPase subunit